jgi:Domain of unknown function (DUF4153)
MEESQRSAPEKASLPLILFAAIVQGWALYGLHHAIEYHHWPATDSAWLTALYALALFIPISVQLLAQYAQSKTLWRFIAALAVAFFYFGWHFGAHVLGGPSVFTADPGWVFPLALLFGVLWLLVLPFVQSRLTTGHWASDYGALFTHAWHNKLMLAEALLFTGLFWLLLFLWQMLFHLLKIDYFRELFKEPIFFYPVTALAFGCALHLIGSITQLTSVVLEQLLNVLKWLATLAAVILTLFTVALVLKLPGLFFTEEKAIGATWLLWLLAVMVLFLNAAYRDGSVLQPYPKWIARSLKAVVPLMVIIALTALYALIVRARHYGLTVERVWALVVAGAGLLYSVGYSIAAFRNGAWLGAISRVNIIVAAALIVVIAAAMTPLLSPFRLAANSQFRLVQERGLKAIDRSSARNPYGWTSYGRNSPLDYLRFDAGQYGQARLKELAGSYAGPDAENVRHSASAVLAQKTRWDAVARVDVRDALGKLHVFPQGRALDAGLADLLVKDLEAPYSFVGLRDFSTQAAGIFIDLNGDNSDEFVLMTFTSPSRGRVYENRQGQWQYRGDVIELFGIFGARAGTSAGGYVLDELNKGNVTSSPSKWSDLLIGTHRYRIDPRN